MSGENETITITRAQLEELAAKMARQTTGDHPDWPPGFLDRAIGAWQGELERPPQSPAEEREEQ